MKENRESDHCDGVCPKMGDIHGSPKWSLKRRNMMVMNDQPWDFGSLLFSDKPFFVPTIDSLAQSWTPISESKLRLELSG